MPSVLAFIFNNYKASVMVCLYPYVSIIASLLSALKFCASDSYVAAVYEHVVILPDHTDIPVSPEEALVLMNRNMDVLQTAIKAAAQQVLSCDYAVIIGHPDFVDSCFLY